MKEQTSMMLTVPMGEFEIEVDYTYSPGRPLKMPSFSDEVGHPAEPDEVEWTLKKLGVICYDFATRKHKTTWLDLKPETLNDLEVQLSLNFDDTVYEAIIKEQS